MPFRTTRTTKKKTKTTFSTTGTGKRRRGRGDGSIRRPPRSEASPRGADSSDPNSDPPLAPGLYLVGTPIGNVEDITLRALRVLRSADAVLAEDTRHTGRLLARYGIRKRLVSYHAHNERARRDHLVARIAGGAALALVSDAGTPAVSDPGADLVKACADACLSVVPIPGPCAPAAAIVAAGALTEETNPGFPSSVLPLRRARDVRGGASFQTRPGRSWRSCPRTSSSPRCKTPRRSWGKDARAWCAGK